MRAVISLAPPGVPNWLDPQGHREGTLIFRWSRSADPVPRIETRLVWREVLRLLREQVSGGAGAGILVTHSAAAAATTDRVYLLTADCLREKP